MTISTWDPANKGTQITLSGSNLIATHSTTASWGSVLSNTSKSTGKAYAEIVLGLLPNDGVSNGASIQLGFAKNDQNVNSFIGASGTDGWVRADMSVFDGSADGGVTYTTANRGFTSAVQNDVISWAIDFDAGKAWVAKNNTFGGTPSSGTNPAFTWTPGGSWFMIWAANAPAGDTNLPASTLHTDTTNQTYSPPSGFTAWDGAAAAATLHRMLTLGVG